MARVNGQSRSKPTAQGPRLTAHCSGTRLRGQWPLASSQSLFSADLEDQVPVPRAASMIYFAYGSNMSSTVMAQRCPGAASLGVARLDHHRLAFELPSQRWGGHAANVVPDASSTVWGVLWNVTEGHLVSLDGVEARYDRYPIMVAQNDSDIMAMTYKVKASLVSPNGGSPHPTYVANILEGATKHGLPENYVSWIRSRYQVPRT